MTIKNSYETSSINKYDKDTKKGAEAPLIILLHYYTALFLRM